MSDVAIATLPPDLQRLIDQTETSMHHIVRAPMSREAAIEIKQRLSRVFVFLNNRINGPKCQPSPELVRGMTKERLSGIIP